MLIDFALISILLVIAQVLRARMPWADRYLVPSSMIAGVCGLIAGPDLLNILPFTVLPVNEGAPQLQLSQYPGVLITLVFATLLMGHGGTVYRSRLSRSSVRTTLLYNLAAEFGQFGLAILFGVFCLSVVFPELPKEFAVMLPAGFAGGHGTSAIFGQAFVSQGWQDALSVGFAFATLGLATSLAGGMLFINIAANCGWTSFVGRVAATPPEEIQSFLPESERFSIGTATVSPVAVDPLTWHVALLGAVYGATVAFDSALHAVFPGDYWIPRFAVAMLIGAFLQFVLDRFGIGQFVDRATMRRLGSLAADLLVVCGIASIKLSVVGQYAGPIAIMAAFGFLYSVGFLLLGYAVFRDHWFERSIFTYGWLTGVVGFSVALLRVVDPRLKSETLEDYGAAYLVIGPVELALYPAIIWAGASGDYLAAGVILTLLAVVMLILARAKASFFPQTEAFEPQVVRDAADSRIA